MCIIFKFNIIIPFYNLTNDLINQLSHTLKQQTIIDDCHITLIDDNSTKGYEELKQKFINTNFANLSYIKNTKRLGPGASRNLGLQYKEAEYIIFLDSNYYFVENNSLDKLYHELKSNQAHVLFHKAYCNTGNFFNMQVVVLTEYLHTLNIKFPNLFIGESLIFQALLEEQSINNNIVYSENIYIMNDLKNECHIIGEILKENTDNDIAVGLSIAYLFLSSYLKDVTRSSQFMEKFFDVCNDDRIKNLNQKNLDSLIKQYQSNLYLLPSIILLKEI